VRESEPAARICERTTGVGSAVRESEAAAAAVHTQSDTESDRHCNQESQPNENAPLQPTQIATESDGDTLRVHHVVLGQLVGFTLIVLVSLCGYALGHFLQRSGSGSGCWGCCPLCWGSRSWHMRAARRCAPGRGEHCSNPQ